MRAVTYLLAIPLLAQQGVDSWSMEKERALGRHYASEIRRQSAPRIDPQLQNYVDRVTQQLWNALPDRRSEQQVEVIWGGDWTEPFALPGGYIFVPARSLISARDEQEFVGTVAHAVAHAALRHGIHRAGSTQASNAPGIPLIFVGGWTGSHADSHDAKLLVPLGFLELQRGYELEADRLGLELSARTGHDASAFLRYVQRTQPLDSRYSPLPQRSLRIARIQEALTPLSTGAPSVSDDFNSLQERVRSIIEPAERRGAPTLRR